jgi:hypothetical protein
LRGEKTIFYFKYLINIYLSRFRSVSRSDNSEFFEDIEDFGGTSVAEGEFALNEGC